MDRLPVSANVPAELAERISDVREAPQRIPSFADEEDLRDVVCPSLSAPLAQLFSTRDQVLMAKRIEGLNYERATDWLLRDIAHLERVLFQLWSEA